MDSYAIALTTKLDAYLSATEATENVMELEWEILDSLRNRSAFNYFRILNKIEYPIEKIHALVERICQLTRVEKQNSPLDLEASPVDTSSNVPDEHDSQLRRRDNQFGILSDSGAATSETESETESDGGSE